MTTESLYVGDVGTLIQITLLEAGAPLDLSGASAKSLILRKPSGACLTKTPAFSGDGTDGGLVYAVESGLLDEPGTWRIQVRVTLPSGIWASDTQSVKVLPLLCGSS